MPKGVVEIANDYGSVGFGGACSPKGDKLHRYIFTIYTLDVLKLDLKPDTNAPVAGFMIHKARHCQSKCDDALWTINVATHTLLYLRHRRLTRLLGGVAVFYPLLTPLAPLGKSIDAPQTLSTTQAIVVDITSVALRGVQHSVMARQNFKRYLTHYLPEAIERSTYMLMSCLVLILIVLWWQPIEGKLWEVHIPWLKPCCGRSFFSGDSFL